MKKLLFTTLAIALFQIAQAQITPSKDLIKQEAASSELSVDMKDPKVFKANVLVIDGSTYKNLCVPANKTGGDCASYENAWKNGYLYTCSGNDGPRLIPFHSGDNFKCYSDGGIIHVQITSTATKQGKKKGIE
ncbi:hypothetical protein [Flavilitoribacter nigricans]|uniref:Uncharacterized protein n=1 Tax=Flavilitoribacter nigricans (strain ATCC 23147 / DSM 23189 / NBRC 102662 / NCIMB 1420 / SS-2) TaxID=1122177 RepID=A0A2D0N118_FLAN2|nr:hypothetical protein [Flavilitoribacter nigricans]PHN02157.1 hypothetical protein CRP01_33755 [Flavilitoribacter nigricans DSM 23189 = NBRC 102662]